MSVTEEMHVAARFMRSGEIVYIRVEDVLNIFIQLENIACRGDQENLNTLKNFLIQSSSKT